MSKIRDSKTKVLGYISAIRTMLDNYPQPKLSDSMEALLNSNTPFGFLMNLLQICGVSSADLLNWVAKILCGQEVIQTWVNKGVENIGNAINDNPKSKLAQGFLDGIEEVIRVLLLTNVKNMFTCSINPFIPDEVLKSPNGCVINNEISFNGGSGIKIPLSTIDMFNTLYHSPTSLFGSALYFDTDYGSNEIWKSTDFNAFLWYVINRGTNVKPENYKLIWDNRVRKRKQLSSNEILKKNFFNIVNGDGSFISINKEEKYEGKTYPNRPSSEDKRKEKKDNNKTQKKQYIIVEYNERDNTTISLPDVLTVYLNADRYVKKFENNFFIKKTVFEFNFDYIYSLKLFDSKVIVANVINSLLGVVNSATASLLNGKYSLQQKIIAGKVGEIVKELINGEDTIINDCFFSFSNDEYEALLNETELKQFNQYQFGDISGEISSEDAKEIIDKINNIGNAGTLEEVQTNIANVFENVASVTAAQNQNVEITDKFTFGNNILFELIKESVVQIVMQVLSPKVIMLFAINSYFMGDITDGDFSKINIQNFLKGLTNLIVSITKQVFDLLIKELIQFLMDEIRPLLILMAEKLLLERVRFYINLFKRLYALLMMFISAYKTNKPISVIDNVNYADIVPSQNEPPKNSC